MENMCVYKDLFKIQQQKQVYDQSQAKNGINSMEKN